MRRRSRRQRSRERKPRSRGRGERDSRVPRDYLKRSSLTHCIEHRKPVSFYWSVIAADTVNWAAHDQILLPPAPAGAIRIFLFFVPAGVLCGAASAPGDSRTARNGLSRFEQRQTRIHTQTIPQELLRCRGRGTEVGLDDRSRHARPCAYRKYRRSPAIL